MPNPKPEQDSAGRSNPLFQPSAGGFGSKPPAPGWATPAITVEPDISPSPVAPEPAPVAPPVAPVDKSAAPVEDEEEYVPRQSRRRQSVPMTHDYEPFTSYIHKKLKQPFLNLIDSVGPNKYILLNQALYDLLVKNGVNPSDLPPRPK